VVATKSRIGASSPFHATPLSRRALNGNVRVRTEWEEYGLPLFSLICALLQLLVPQRKRAYESCLDSLQRTGKLWGVCQVATDEDETVTLVDARNAGYGYGLTMYDSGGQIGSPSHA